MAEEYVSPGRSSPRSAQYAQIHGYTRLQTPTNISMESKQPHSILKDHQQMAFYLTIGPMLTFRFRRTPESDLLVEEPKDGVPSEVPASDEPAPEVTETPVEEAIANEEPAPEEAKEEAPVEDSTTSNEIPSSEEPIAEEIVAATVVEDSDPAAEPEG